VTLGNPTALYLLALAAGIVALYFLRARSRTVEVSALFLWEGLRDDPRTRAARLRRRIDPLLLLQLLLLSAVVGSLAAPGLRSVRPQLSRLAIVLDASASMRSAMEDGETRFHRARSEALDVFGRYATTPVAVVLLTASPRLIAAIGENSDEARRALEAARPTWEADGTIELLTEILASQGGLAEFDRVVFIGDHALPSSLGVMEQIVLERGGNLAITSFHVREDDDQEGCTAYVRLLNEASAYREATVVVSDGLLRARQPVLLPPNAEQGLIIPFPGSAGPTFTAAVEPGDASAYDDTRYFALDRTTDLRVRWIGTQNRYLEAALRAAAPATLVDAEDTAPVDLTIVYDAPTPLDITGNLLLVHTGLQGILWVGFDTAVGTAITAYEDPLLEDVSPFDFRAASLPETWLPPEAEIVVALDDRPLLARWCDSDRRIVLLTPDLMRTNLPLTADFPLLVRNVLSDFARLPAGKADAWLAVAEPVDLSTLGAVSAISDPAGRLVEPPEHAGVFTPEIPGIYTVTTSRGIISLAANVPVTESLPPPTETEADPTDNSEQQTATTSPLWPLFAGAALLCLAGEAGVYHGLFPRRWHR